MQKILYLLELKPYRTNWYIQVKAIHTWKKLNPKFGELESFSLTRRVKKST
ncbi:unnamed protein product [Brassica rapa subsp. trilocularis]